MKDLAKYWKKGSDTKKIRGALKKRLETDDIDRKLEEIISDQRDKSVVSAMLLWASLCMDEVAAKEELTEATYRSVYEKTNGEVLLRKLFDIRPRHDNVINRFYKYTRNCESKLDGKQVGTGA